MKILIDIGHPAHVHFFYHSIQLLVEQGHQVLITSRDKDIAINLLDNLSIRHESLSTLSKRGGTLSLLIELVYRDIKLFNVVRKFKPEVMAGIGGIFIAHVGKLKNIPSLVFYDTENATLQNALTYPLASCVIVPDCYKAWLPKARHIKYAGYHELAYLRKDRFTPDHEIAIKNGLAKKGDTFLLRLVSWQASHDIGKNGWNLKLLKQVIATLRAEGKVIISSESILPPELQELKYKGDIAEIHHLMAYCRGYIGESATMASECAVLGVPAIYAAETDRGYMDEQEYKYGLVKNVKDLTWNDIEAALSWLLSLDKIKIKKAQNDLHNRTIDVTKFIVDCILRFPLPLSEYQKKAQV